MNEFLIHLRMRKNHFCYRQIDLGFATHVKVIEELPVLLTSLLLLLSQVNWILFSVCLNPLFGFSQAGKKVQ